MGAGASLRSCPIPAAFIMGMGTGLFLHSRLVSTALLMDDISAFICVCASLIAGDFRHGGLIATILIVDMSARNFLSRLLITTILIVDMGARLAFHGFYIAALCGMLYVMFT